jgi:hypothetical protein
VFIKQVVDPRQNTLSGSGILPANKRIQDVELQTIDFENHDAIDGGPRLRAAAEQKHKNGKTAKASPTHRLLAV